MFITSFCLALVRPAQAQVIYTNGKAIDFSAIRYASTNASSGRIIAPFVPKNATNGWSAPIARPAVSSKAQRIKLTADGARADFGLQKVDFDANIASERPIKIITPDGQKLWCRPFALAYYDSQSDQSVVLGRIKDCTGVIQSSSKIIYRDAFSNLRADVQYEYTASHVEQNIILRQRPPAPETFGLNPDTTQLEVWTIWPGASKPREQQSRVTLRPGASGLAKVTANDSALDFGTMKIARGKAFNLDTDPQPLSVAKEWHTMQDGGLLAEIVDYRAVRQKLLVLPTTSAITPKTKGVQRYAKRSEMIQSLASAKPEEIKSKSKMLVAQVEPQETPGVLMDFIMISSVPVPSGAMGWWAAGGNPSDSIGTNNGVMMNGATYGPGEVGEGFSVDGTSSYVKIPYSPSLNPSNQFTVEFWMNADAGNDMDSYQGLVTSDFFGVEISNGYWGNLGLNFFISPDWGSTWNMISSANDGGAAVTAAEWHHVAGTYDGTNMQLYVDGEAWGNPFVCGGNISPMPTEGFLAIGSEEGRTTCGCARYFNGVIDEVTTYNRALSASEIALIYNAGGAGKLNPDCVTSPTNAVGWWPGDGNAYDFARTNFGILQGAATYSSGRVGQAFSLDGNDSYVEVGNSDGWNFRTNNFSIELWVNFRDLGYGNLYYPEAIFAAHDEGGGDLNKWIFGLNGRLLTLLVDDPIVGVKFLGQVPFYPDLNTWYHVALVRNGGALSAYVNGVLAGTNSINANILDANATLTIGQAEGIGYVNGMIDELAIYNRALTGTEIASIYSAGGAGKCRVDSDHDGLTDLQESFLKTNPWNSDSDGDGVSDGDEVFVYHTAPMNPDSDYDGIGDGQELADGTDPNNANSAVSRRLGYWSFDNTNTWAGAAGQLPLLASNLVGVSSWNTNALLADRGTNFVLAYRDVETNGTSNINLRKGSIRFWFKPDWSSANVGGTGPQSEGRLIEMGTKGSTDGWWGLVVKSSGTNIYLGTQTNSTGTLTTNLIVPISWTSNVWHQVVLTYGVSNASFYVDGLPAITNGVGIVYYPALNVRTNGFTIGSSASGTNQVRGAFDEMETFNYPLDASTIRSNYLAVTSQDKNGNGLGDFWEWQNFGQTGIDPNADPDGDGLSNLQEFQGNTDPNTFNQARLGYWRFDNAPGWQDEQGLNPNVISGLFPIPSWSGDAVKISPSIYSSLGYPKNRPNGLTVVSLPVGSIRFWFKPDWSSYDSGQGNGPGDTIRLFEMGRQSDDATYGWFALTVNPAGTKLILTTEAGGIHNENATYPINFNSKTWYQIALAYSPSNSVLYVNAQGMATNGLGLTNLPSQSALQAGFHVGSSWDGIQQANGLFDELETFNYPLSAWDVATNYEAIMSVDSDGDGLPNVVENALGSRSDAVDSDCDGLPDAWEVANGLDPRNPNDATSAMIAAYASGTNVLSPNFQLFAVQTNMINVGFVTSASSALGSKIDGQVITSRGSNDSVWNFTDIHSDFMGGVSLMDAAGTTNGSRLYAYLGPCLTPFIVPPTPPQMGGGVLITGGGWSESCTTYTNVNRVSYPGYLVTNFYPCPIVAGVSCDSYMMNVTNQPGRIESGTNIIEICNTEPVATSTFFTEYSDIGFLQGHNAYENPIWGSDYAHTQGAAAGFTDYGVANYVFFQSWYHPLVQNYGITTGHSVLYPGLADPFHFYYDDEWNKNGPYYSLSQDEQTNISQGFADATSYSYYLNSYIGAHGFSVSSSGNAPEGVVSCFIPPFASISHTGGKLAGNDGALWRFSGASETLSGGWFKIFYPQAKRTLLVSGLLAGQYTVYIYFDSPLDVAPAKLNNVPSITRKTPAGLKYWYGKTAAKAFNTPSNLYQCKYAPAPVWAMTNRPGAGSIQIDLDSPNVFDSTTDFKVLGLQIVRTGDLAPGTNILEVRPGGQAAYLNWSPSDNATNYNVYKAIGSTNSWTLAGTTTNITYKDTSLTAGTTYYYRVVGVDSGAILEPSSSVVSVVPFGCPDPLPPRIDYVNPLQTPQASGVYNLNYQLLFTNSDTFDPQGYPLIFRVESVVSGSLLIDGSPFGVGNNTISSNTSVVWTPPASLAAPGTPVFRVYVFDGINRSVKTVDVKIIQKPKTYLMAWGSNNALNSGGAFPVGCLGTGEFDSGYSAVETNGSFMPNFDNYPAFKYQNYFNIYPYDPRWHINFNIAWAGVIGQPPKRVLDIDTADAVSCFGDIGLGHAAITADKHLWFWGEAESYSLGMPLVFDFQPSLTNVVYQLPFTHAVWNSSILDQTTNIWIPLDLTILSPVPVLDPATGQPLTGVSAAKNSFILKENGVLLSFGRLGALLGRVPEMPTDLYAGAAGTIGMIPSQVEIEGNDRNGVIPGREIVEINTSGGYFDETGGTAALARCKDGSLWAWGALNDAGAVANNQQFYSLRLSGDTTGDNLWKPTRLTNVESAATSPIRQIKESMNHIVIWREDGSLSELGYVPKNDSGLWTVTNCLTGLYGTINRSVYPNFDDYYSLIPVPVSNVPSGIRQICVAPSFGAILTDSGDVWVWGHWIDKVYQTPQKIQSLYNITKIIAGYQYIIGLDKKGRLWGVGLNNDGAFGFNDLVLENTSYGTMGYIQLLPVDKGGVVHTKAVRVAGVENVVDIFSGDAAWASQVYAIGTEVQGKPVGLIATPMSQAVQLTWSNYPAASSYVIYRSLSEESGYVPIGNTTANSYLDQSPPLQNGQIYYYEVSAVVNGVETLPSWYVDATPYPSPYSVTNLTVSWACHGAKLQWQPPVNVASSPVNEYVVQADGVQLAELFASSTNYYDDRPIITANTVYTVMARNSAGQATNSVVLTTNSPFVDCEPAPVIATNLNQWLSLVPDNNGGSDYATLLWAGPVTNNAWLFQKYEFDTDLGNASASPTETVSPFITRLTEADSDTAPLPAWLWSQFNEGEINALTGTPGVPSVSDTINALAHADPVTNYLQAWVWSQFTTAETNDLLNSSLSLLVRKADLIQDLGLLITDQYDPANIVYYGYVQQLLSQLNTEAGSLDANTLNIKSAALTSALNRILTNGQPVSNLDFFISAVANGYYADNYNAYASLRQATTNLFNTLPQGAGLVQLKRMLLDDCFGGSYFTRGPNWGGNLGGFKIHYHILQYVNGRKLENNFSQAVTLNNLRHGRDVYDGENTPWELYKFKWSIPQGSLCWASVSAVVDGEESEVSNEIGPKRASNNSSWNAALRAVPGCQQVYLDWAEAPDAFSYDVYYSTNSGDTNYLTLSTDYDTSWQPVPGGTNLTINRCWHTNLTVNTTYYYMLIDNDYFYAPPPQSAFTTVADYPANSQTNFSASASAYDNMVLVEWMVPKTNLTDPNVITQTNWQFFVERKLTSDAHSSYQVVSDIGFGLAYLDSDVLNGQTYIYRVTAFDQAFNRLQTLAVAKGGSSTQITPSATNNLTLLDPIPGNGFVDLAWSPIRANQFSIKHSLSPTGPFEVVDTLNVSDAYQSAKNTYRHKGLQNGVMHYYQIAALTPTGFELDSDVKGAMPLTTLTPLPPDGFHGTIIPILGANTVALAWNPESGINQYQVFLQDQSSMTPLFTGSGTACTYAVEPLADQNAVFTFALRSLNAQGLASDLIRISVTNQIAVSSTDANSVVLQIAGIITNSLTVTGPTNLTLSAEVNVPGVSQVSFYDDGKLIGTASEAPFQMIWYHVPGKQHDITAVALATSQSAPPELGLGGNSSGTFSSASTHLTVNVEPQLSAYQTSATDLQLPTPALPISLSRLYTSRSTDTNSILGVGWTAGWNVASVKLSHPFVDGWNGVTQTGFASSIFCYVSDSVGHNVTVTLPDGENIGFASQLQCDIAIDGNGAMEDVGPTAQVSFQPYSQNSGVFSGGLNALTVAYPVSTDYLAEDAQAYWNGVSVGFESATLSDVSYTAPDGTFYQFGKPLSDGLTWLITQVTDRNGNSLNYLYDGDNKLTTISNSCGRQVTFGYSSPTTGITNISVTNMLDGAPVVVYVISNNLLTEVRQLVDRTGSGTYLTNRYAYGTAGADANRLTDVFDARGVLVLHNIYTNSTGDLLAQISPGRTNLFKVDENYNLTVIAQSSTATNTVKVTSDSSGAISGATQPVSGTAASSTNAVQTTYDDRGRLIAQTDANGNVKTYAYDDQDRLVGQSDENGNSTAVELNDFGQPNISTDANGKQTLYIYDNAGNPTSVKDPSGTATTYAYSDPVTDATGHVRLGAMLTRQSQSAPFVPYTIVTLNSNKTTGTILGDLVQTTETWQDSGGNNVGSPVTTSYAYDANGNRTNETKFHTVTGGVEQIVNAYTYDAMNRVVKTVVSASVNGTTTLSPQTNTVTYNLLGKQATSTDAAGRSTTNVYDFNGNLIETAYPDDMVSRTAYDGFGRQLYVQERAVNATTTTAPATRNTYDASGRVIKVERCDAVQLTRNVAIPTVDFSGTTNEVVFKMTVANTGSVLTTTRTFYDSVGRVQYSADARGAVTEYRYDAAGRRTNVLVYAQGLGLNDVPSPSTLTSQPTTTSYTYDANGNQLTVTDAAGHTTRLVYDDANRVKEVKYPDANASTVSRFTYYDGLGRKIQESDEAGVNTAYTYDFRGLLTSVTLAFGTTQAVTTVYGYDELGNEIKQTDAAGHSTTNRYDALGRRTARLLPGGQSEGYCYDRYTGNLLYQTNFNGMVITNQYDFASGRLTNCSATGFKTTYAYSPTGLRTNMTDASGTNSYYYNSLSQLTNKTVTWIGQSPVKLNYGYDAFGSLTNLYSSTANGVSNAYQMDVLGRITNVLVNGNSAASYGFDVVGNLQSMRYGNGVTNLYQYDQRNRLTNMVWKSGSTALASFAYTLGATGNRTTSSESVNGTSRSYAWSYDYLYRLTSEGIQNIGTVNYGFDAVGNRTNRTSTVTGIANQTPSYTANDWLTSDGYDSNGSTTNSSGSAYQYDVLNHLTNATIGGAMIQIVYDGDGNRVKKSVGGVTTYYLVDDRNPSGYIQVLEEYQGATLSKVYSYGLALISQRVPNSSTNYFICDGPGSARMLVNTVASIVNTFAYDAYGMLIASNGVPQTAYLYCGEQFDFDQGFYLLRARYLNPNTGRFITMDTYEGYREVPTSLHKYLYAELDPINRTDPSGHMSATQIGVTVHKYIGEQFMEEVPGGISGPSVVSILEGIPGFKLPPNLQGVVTSLFPDLTDVPNKQVYEIKPDNARSLVLGEAQLQAYIDLFNYLDPRKGWHRGTTYSPPLKIPINALTYAVAVKGAPGMILYQTFDIQKIVERKAVQAAVAENAENENDVGIASLDAILGAF